MLAPRSDEASLPRIVEQEPNDSPEQAQLLVLNADWPVLTVDGSLAGPGQTNNRDVDVFKLVVPGGQPNGGAVAPSVDSAAEKDRGLARRLSLEIAPEGSSNLTLQLLDDGAKALATVAADAGDRAGLPNMAVMPGRVYFFRVKALVKSAKAGADSLSVAIKYKLTVQLGDFEMGDEHEPNDAIATAESVVMLGPVELAGLHGWAHDQDVYRIAAPQVPSVVEVVLDSVKDVAPGLQVWDGQGAKLALARGRRGEPLALHNVLIPLGAADAGPASQFFYVVVRGEVGSNRTDRYVLHLAMGIPNAGAEVEPNDNPINATLVHDGVITGYLPMGDVDYFRYVGDGPADVTIEVASPAHVRPKVDVIRQRNGETMASVEAQRAHQSVSLANLSTLGEPLLIRLTQGKGDGNASEAYSLKISSAPTQLQKAGSTNPSSPLNPN